MEKYSVKQKNTALSDYFSKAYFMLLHIGCSLDRKF